MSNTASLQATERDTTLNPRQLRSAGFIPATLYGKGRESLSIQVRELDFSKLYGKGSKEFELVGLPQSARVKVQHLQSEAVGGKLLSIEFLYLDAPADSAKPVKKVTQAEGTVQKPEEAALVS